MCQYMIQIAEVTKERVFFRCEHGTFHLLWDTAVFSLTLEELYSLKGLLVDTRMDAPPAEQKHRLRIQRRVSANGVDFFELWMTEVGIRLLSKDCQSLEKLVGETLTWVQTQPPFTPEGHAKAAQLLVNMDSLPITMESFHWN